MRAEREKLNAKITAGSLRLTSGQLELPAEPCHIILFSGGSCTVRCGDTALLVSPGCVLLLGPGAWVVSQAGHALPEMLGCGFPLTALHEMKNATGEDFLRLFAPGSQMALYGSVQWASRLRTLLEMMRSAMGEPEYPGGLYLALTVYHPELLPTSLALKIATTRQSIPFSVAVEVISMELAFELLREAGVRLPSPVSATIGIVGGIIIGSAAVDAGLVSPAVVIISALTGICSFVIPNISVVSGLWLS